MKKLGTFPSKTWGTVHVTSTTYDGPDGPLAIVLLTDDAQVLAKLSVNMYKPQCSQSSTELPKDCFYVKNYGENTELAAEAAVSGLFQIRTDMPSALSGYIVVPVWQIAS